ncbi:ABC transporter substrate-binding protein [Hypericibacter sp.]|uniref:ABC transporter substrate-binding protein n=1 Tax=Hypericibacter sp. TaxID=2705401 RepID=UPI003D6D962D
MGQRNDDEILDRLLLKHQLGRRDLLKRSMIAGAGALGASWLAGRSKSAFAAAPKKGGNLRVAMLGGSSSDTLDAHVGVVPPDFCRNALLYNGLVQLDNDAKLVNALAESLEPNATATEWTVRLRKNAKFHNGKSVTAADVAFTFNRIGSPDKPLFGAGTLARVDLKNMKALDDRTLRIPMNAPFATFPEAIAPIYFFAIVPADYDPAKPVGTGPFKFESFTPGQQSVFTRFDDYWEDGLPYLDSVTVIDSFANDTAAFNALQGGEVDAFAFAPLALAKQVTEGGPIQALVSKPGQWTPFTMRVDQAPFDDVNVRQAFRLLVDRKQMINLALSGYGAIGNDVFSQWDPCYDKSLLRDQDIDQAKFLLKKAGKENLEVELVTSDFAAGVLLAAQVFAQQATKAGVKVNVRQVTGDIFYGDQYLKWPFAQDFWNYNPYLSQVAQGYQAGAAYNETHWDDANYNKLYNEALATIDDGKRCEIIKQMQKIDFEQGGYIIWSYNQSIDLLTENVQGLGQSATGFSMGNYGFNKAWLA